MRKRYFSPGDRLIRMILKHRGAATVRQIAWSGLRGADLDLAKRETKDLVTWEHVHVYRSHQRSLTARLTDRGVWHAIRLSKTYDPTLLAVALAAPAIETILARLEGENHPLAVKIGEDRHDAEQWRNRQKRDAAAERKEWQTIERVQTFLNKIVDKKPYRVTRRDINTLNTFLEKKGQRRIEPVYLKPGETPPAAPATEHVAYPSPSDRVEQPAAIAPQVRNTSHAQLSDFEAALRLQNQAIGTSRRPERFVQNRPEPTAGESVQEIITRANIAGYPTRGGREVMLESVWVPAATWARAVPR